MSGRNFDYPQPLRGQMAKNSLLEIARDANDLRTKLRDDDTLPGWVDLYLATSADRLHTASTYMQNRIAQFQPSNMGDVYDAEIVEMEDGTYAGPMDWIGAFSKESEVKSHWSDRYKSAAMFAFAVCAPFAGVIAYNRSGSVVKALGASVASVPYLGFVAFKSLGK